MECKILVLQCFYFTSNHKINVERKNVVTNNVFALNVEMMQIHIFTINWNDSIFKQNLAEILTEAMYLDRRHPFMQNKKRFWPKCPLHCFCAKGTMCFNINVRKII